MDLWAEIVTGYALLALLFLGYLIWDASKQPVQKSQWELEMSQQSEAQWRKTRKGEDEICFGNPDRGEDDVQRVHERGTERWSR